MKTTIGFSLFATLFLSSTTFAAKVSFAPQQLAIAGSVQFTRVDDFLTNDAAEKKYNLKDDQIYMSKSVQDFGDGITDIRYNQVAYNKPSNELMASTTTFDGKFLRSTTFCRGSIANGTVTGSRDVYCATASQKACDRVLAAYYSKTGARSDEAKAAQNKKVEACISTMKDYADILRGYSNALNGNQAVAGARGELVAKEGQAMDLVLGKINTDALYTTTNINELKTESEMEKVAQKLTSSVSGLQQISDFIRLCEDNKRNWNPKYADPNSARSWAPGKAAGSTR